MPYTVSLNDSNLRTLDMSDISSEDEIPIFRLWFNSILSDNRTSTEKRAMLKIREPREGEIEKAKRWWSLKKIVEKDSNELMMRELDAIKEELKTESLRLKLIDEDSELGPGITYNPLFDHKNLRPVGKGRTRRRRKRKRRTLKRRTLKRQRRKRRTQKRKTRKRKYRKSNHSI